MESSKGIKVILLGESGVGKTNLINVVVGKAFESNTESSSVSSFIENRFEYNNKKYLYCLWDTAGQEKFRSLNQMFIKGSKIVLIVFSIVDQYSFKQIEYWINYAKEVLGKGKYILALVANKSDLYEDQIVSDNVIIRAAQKYNIKYVITSACTSADGFRLFLHELIKDYIELIGPVAETKLNFMLGDVKANKNKDKNKNIKTCC